MAITRSQIARQLLAEGGAPRKGFYVGVLQRTVKTTLVPLVVQVMMDMAEVMMLQDQLILNN